MAGRVGIALGTCNFNHNAISLEITPRSIHLVTTVAISNF